MLELASLLSLLRGRGKRWAQVTIDHATGQRCSVVLSKHDYANMWVDYLRLSQRMWLCTASKLATVSLRLADLNILSYLGPMQDTSKHERIGCSANSTLLMWQCTWGFAYGCSANITLWQCGNLHGALHTVHLQLGAFGIEAVNAPGAATPCDTSKANT